MKFMGLTVDAPTTQATSTMPDEFDDLVMEARDLGIGDWTTAAKTDALASRIKRLVERKRKATASPSQSAGS